MPISIIDNFTVNTTKNIDSRLGPYVSVAQATGSISTLLRYVGMTITVTGSGQPVEYWFNPTTADTDLVLKTASATGFVTTSSFNAFTSSYNTGSFTGSFTGSLLGTSSYSINALTASYVNTLQQDVIISGSLSNGLVTIISGIYSHAEGYYTKASSPYSHAEGFITEAFGVASHAEGYYASSSGNFSHAEGAYTRAIGGYSHAEGGVTRAIGSYSHAEGLNTDASGNYSHAEGFNTEAFGEYSHAEGFNTEAFGLASHAEGNSTLASGSYSHAEGNSTIASGSYSHAEGFGTIASGDFQHVQGTYNKSSSFIGAFILGNGTDNSNRSNLIFASGSSVQITGSLNVSGSITGSLLGTASYSINALTASYSINALTASYVNTLQQDVIISGSIFTSEPIKSRGIYVYGTTAEGSLYNIPSGSNYLIDFQNFPIQQNIGYSGGTGFDILTSGVYEISYKLSFTSKPGGETIYSWLQKGGVESPFQNTTSMIIIESSGRMTNYTTTHQLNLVNGDNIGLVLYSDATTINLVPIQSVPNIPDSPAASISIKFLGTL
jgi:hypothetical protein